MPSWTRDDGTSAYDPDPLPEKPARSGRATAYEAAVDLLAGRRWTRKEATSLRELIDEGVEPE